MATTVSQRPARYEPPAPMNAIGEGATPLMYACQQGRDNEVRSILANKPNASLERDRTRKTALHYCAETVAPSCAELLLTTTPSLLDSRDEDGYTALHLAVIAGNRPLIKLLLARGADVNSLDHERHSVVHWATVCGEVEALELVLDAGADASTPDIHGGYPIHYAAQMCGPNSEMGNDVRFGLAVLRKLLARGVAVDVADQDGRQPILWAASAGSADAILALVNAGANVEADDKDGLTALHCAASRGHTDCLETLVTLCGAEVDVIDSNGCTALFYSVTLGHADSTRLLLGYGAEPNRQDRKGRTPAHCGAAKGQLETLRILGAHGANLWVRNVKGDYPLHEAVASGRKDLVRWLLSQRPDAVNSPNNDGRCPLHIAAINNNMEMCKIVLDHQALLNPVMRTSKGQLMTPMDAALHRGNRGCAKYLQLHGGVPASKLTDKAARIKGGANRPPISETQSEPYTTPDCVQTIPIPRGGISLANSPMGEMLHDARRSESRALQVRLNDDVAIRHVERIDAPVVCRHRAYDDESSEEERMRRRRRRRRRAHRRTECSLDRASDVTDEDVQQRRRHGRRRREPSDTDSEELRYARRRRRGRTRSSGDSDISERERVRAKRRSQESDTEYRRSTRNRSERRRARKDQVSVEDEEEEEEHDERDQRLKNEEDSSNDTVDEGKSNEKTANAKNEVRKRKVQSKKPVPAASKSKEAKKQKARKEDNRVQRKDTKEVVTVTNEKETNSRKQESRKHVSKNKESENEQRQSESKRKDSVKLTKKTSEGGSRSSKDDTNDVTVTHQVVTVLVHREERDSVSGKEEDKKNGSEKEKEESVEEESKSGEDDGSAEQSTKYNEDPESTETENGSYKTDITVELNRESDKQPKEATKYDKEEAHTDKEDVCVEPVSKKEKKRTRRKAVTQKEVEISKLNKGKEETAETLKSSDREEISMEINRSSHDERKDDVPSTEENVDGEENASQSKFDEDVNEEIKFDIEEADKEEAIPKEEEKDAEEGSKSETDSKIPKEEIDSGDETLKGEEEENGSQERSAGSDKEAGEDEEDRESEKGQNSSEQLPTSVKDAAESMDDASISIKEGSFEHSSISPQEKGSLEQVAMSDKEDVEEQLSKSEKEQEDENKLSQSDKEEESIQQTSKSVEGEEEKEGDEVGKDSEGPTTKSDKDQESFEEASVSSKEEETVCRTTKSSQEESSKKSDKEQASLEQSQKSGEHAEESGSENERVDVETESEVQELDKDSTERTLSSRSRNGDSGFEPSPRRDKTIEGKAQRGQTRSRVSRPCRDGASDDERPEVSTVSVTQAVQNSMRKYHMERRIFQQLLELKRLQIRAGRANENVLVKRLVDDYRRAGLIVGLRHYEGPYTFRSFEKYLYDQLRLLQTSERRLVPRLQSSDDLDKLQAALRRARLNNVLLGDVPDNPVLCTHGTHRCHHAAHAYTGVPCAAYITKPNHHHQQKQQHPKSGFLPRIDSSNSRAATRSLRYVDPARPVTLELSHGTDKQVISLPTEKLDRNKRYYVTFTIKGGPTGKEDGKNDAPTQEDQHNMRHRHAKSL